MREGYARGGKEGRRDNEDEEKDNEEKERLGEVEYEVTRGGGGKIRKKQRKKCKAKEVRRGKK